MKRNIIIIILLLLLSTVSWYVMHLRTKNAELYQLTQAQDQEATTWRNKHGNSQARVKTLEIDYKTLEGLYEDWVDSLSRELEIRSKRVQSAVSIGIRNERELRVPVQTDSAGNKTAIYQSKHFRLKAMLNDDFLTVDTHSLDSLGFVFHLLPDPGLWSRLTGQRTLHADVVSYNPYTTFTGLRSWQKAVPPQRWGIGPFLGYDPLRNEISFGVSIHYSIISL